MNIEGPDRPVAFSPRVVGVPSDAEPWWTVSCLPPLRGPGVPLGHGLADMFARAGLARPLLRSVRRGWSRISGRELTRAEAGLA